ncbi:MAG: hypothetical protein ACK57U_04050 [Planctomycetota bacterium]
MIGRNRLQPLSDEVEFERDERSWGVIRSVEGAPPHGAAVPEPVVRRKAG